MYGTHRFRMCGSFRYRRTFALVLCVSAHLSGTQLLRAQTSAVAAASLVVPEDIRFMQDMIGHHAQALVMTKLLPRRTRRADMRLLAERISVSQRDEIALMRLWLARHAGASTASPTDHQHHQNADHASMPGMLSETQLGVLRTARGAQFDRLFLEGMIQHHEGALVMVRTLLTSERGGQQSAIFRFASDVDADQRAEIVRMQRMLAAM
jgi:uncharacterized protein (DUF305 family)